MHELFSRIRHWNIGTRLTLLIFLMVTVLLVTFMTLINHAAVKIAEDRGTEDVQANTRIIIQMLNTFDRTLQGEIKSLSGTFKDMAGKHYSLDPANSIPVAGTATPALLADGTVLNMNDALPDRFTQTTGGVATVFVRKGDDYVRIATSLRDDRNERVLGTALAHDHPAFASINAGRPYVGNAILFGRSFVARYDPMVDSSGNVIGILFVGLDFTRSAHEIIETIASIKIGKTGYFYAINATGANAGLATLHPTLLGQDLSTLKDATGQLFVREVLDKKTGIMRYEWPDAQGRARTKLISFDYMPGWDWIIVGGTYTEEYTEDTTAVINFYRTAGIILLLGLGALIYFMIRKTLGIPLGIATRAAQTLARGDLTVHINNHRQDEIGELINAINGIGHGLSAVIDKVRTTSQLVAHSSHEIAAGNLDLSRRTESQATALEQTSAAMGELTDTVRNNSSSTNQAYSLVNSTSTLAVRGGEMTTQVMENMDSIRASANKIVDIITLIDGIAFQTNILALNASVEAARAGEQGRGFAVVAGEVRTLAQRAANAAHQITALINDSVSKVESGYQLASDTETMMKDIVAAIQKVNQVIASINRASEEQSASIVQVNAAIGQMDEVTQRNAALVEESAAAANSLEQESANLVATVEAFKTSTSQVRVPLKIGS